MGRKETFALFKQYPNRSTTLKEQPYDLDKFRAYYLTSRDWNGYSCAQLLITEVPEKERWTEFKRLFYKSSILSSVFKGWQAELEDLLRSEAIQIIASSSSAPADITRARLIMSGELFGKSKSAGRPAKGQKRNARLNPNDIPATENLDRIIELKRKDA